MPWHSLTSGTTGRPKESSDKGQKEIRAFSLRTDMLDWVMYDILLLLALQLCLYTLLLLSILALSSSLPSLRMYLPAAVSLSLCVLGWRVNND